MDKKLQCGPYALFVFFLAILSSKYYAMEDKNMFFKQQYVQACKNGTSQCVPVSIIATGWAELPYVVERLSNDALMRYVEQNDKNKEGRLARDMALSEKQVKFLTLLRAIGNVFTKIKIMRNGTTREFMFSALETNAENDVAVLNYQDSLQKICTDEFLGLVATQKRVPGYIKCENNQLSFSEIRLIGAMPAISFGRSGTTDQLLQEIKDNEAALLSYVSSFKGTEIILEKEGHLWKWSPEVHIFPYMTFYLVFGAGVIMCITYGFYKKYGYRAVYKK